MKIWQLCACLGDEQDIFNQYFPNLHTVFHGRDEVDNAIIIAALAQSVKQLYKDNVNYLRLYQVNNSDPVIQIYSILDAYNNFGGDAITEVFDYGSYPI